MSYRFDLRAWSALDATTFGMAAPFFGLGNTVLV